MPTKQNKKEKKKCTQHHFVLKAKDPLCYYPQTVNIDFCKSGVSMGKAKKTEVNCYQGPVFNKDWNFQTPTFIVASEKKNFQPNEFKNNTEHENRYSNYDCEKSVLYVPKPNSKSMYCSVCKQKYQDYKDHISTSKHKHNIRINKFSNFIQEQVQNFKEKDPIHSATATQSNVIVISDDDEDLNHLHHISFPNKRIKRSEQFYENKRSHQQSQQKNYPNDFTRRNSINSTLPQHPFFPYHDPVFNYPFHLNFNYNFNVLGMNSLPMGQPLPTMMPNMPQVPYFPSQMPQNPLSMQYSLVQRMQKPNFGVREQNEK